MDVTMHLLRGPQSHLIYATCHWVSVFKFRKHLKLFFIFYRPYPFFWVFESWKQWSKTPPNRCSSVGPTRFGWWIMKLSDITQFSSHPNKLLDSYTMERIFFLGLLYHLKDSCCFTICYATWTFSDCENYLWNKKALFDYMRK